MMRLEIFWDVILDLSSQVSDDEKSKFTILAILQIPKILMFTLGRDASLARFTLGRDAGLARFPLRRDLVPMERPNQRHSRSPR